MDLSKRGDAFSLADRDKTLDNIEAEPILVHIAQAENARYVCMYVCTYDDTFYVYIECTEEACDDDWYVYVCLSIYLSTYRYPYEVLMRSVMKHLVEAATCEYLFKQDFFKSRGKYVCLFVCMYV